MYYLKVDGCCFKETIDRKGGSTLEGKPQTKPERDCNNSDAKGETTFYGM